MSLKYEPSTEPLHISAKVLLLHLTGCTLHAGAAQRGVLRTLRPHLQRHSYRRACGPCSDPRCKPPTGLLLSRGTPPPLVFCALSRCKPPNGLLLFRGSSPPLVSRSLRVQCQIFASSVESRLVAGIHEATVARGGAGGTCMLPDTPSTRHPRAILGAPPHATSSPEPRSKPILHEKRVSKTAFLGMQFATRIL